MDIRDLFELEHDVTFQKLNQQVNSFNPLKVLRMENYEVRHSNMLAWFLDPKENHRLNDYFLRKVLEHLLLIDENAENILFDQVANLLNYSLIESHVYREVKTSNNRYIDLVIVNQQLKTVVLIENKFYSTESRNQLNDYLHYIQQIFEDFTIIPIYLTLDGEAPSNNHYFIFTYEKVESILEHLILIFEGQLHQSVLTFISYYREILREKFYPDEEQIIAAFEVFKRHSTTLAYLEQWIPNYQKLQFEASYEFEFLSRYKNTIQYINKHGNNILSYSFELFIKTIFSEDILYKTHPTRPCLLPTEWQAIENTTLREPQYWLGEGLVVWFEKQNDNRLKMIAEIGPIEHRERLALIEKLERNGYPFKESSKTEHARYTVIYSKKIDINKWDDTEELKEAMLQLYEDPAFVALRQTVEKALNNDGHAALIETTTADSRVVTGRNLIAKAFKKWAMDIEIPEHHYRVTTKHISFTIPLFDLFKELLGETRMKWWWHNGPFLLWYEYNENRIYFTLEVGPIEAEKRVKLMEAIQEEGIKFNAQGLKLTAKYTRIYSNHMNIQSLEESNIIALFDELYHDEELQSILAKLQIIFDEMKNE